ncbi:MAG: circularly permuted type 2 ATP-grasp protein, partial [Acetobacteraceae bacterium]|nr:circularly permuted type 2 ATP-grasp protein [Acetobacteraceae bacterium]
MSNGGAIQPVRDRLAALPLDDLKRCAANADAELRDLGITFTVYSERDAADRALPFDCIPNVLSAEDWARTEAGVCRRVAALNHLLHDIHHDQTILADGVIPPDLVLGNANYRPVMRGVDLPHRTCVNVCGTDIVRDSSGGFMVVGDNARTPSGVGYVVENRHKTVYAYMPGVIRYYLDQDPILPNVETHICREPEALRYTLGRLEGLVAKPVSESGGYGITIGPRASKQELEECRARLLANPANHIGQPSLYLPVAPTLVEGRVEPRHVDLRPFAVTGAKTWVLPGGLTRVAPRRGSLVVNSSQGGGSK